MIKYIQRKKTKGWTLEKECKKLGIKQEDVVFCGEGTKWECPFELKKNLGKGHVKNVLGTYILNIDIDTKDIVKELKGKTLMCDCSVKDFKKGLCHCCSLIDLIKISSQGE